MPKVTRSRCFYFHFIVDNAQLFSHIPAAFYGSGSFVRIGRLVPKQQSGLISRRKWLAIYSKKKRIRALCLYLKRTGFSRYQRSDFPDTFAAVDRHIHSGGVLCHAAIRWIVTPTVMVGYYIINVFVLVFASGRNPLLDKEYRQQQQHLQHYHPCISSCSPYHQIYSPADTTAMTKMAVVNSRPACALADDGHRLLEAATTETTTSTLHSDGYQLSNQVTCSAAPDDPDVTRVQTAQAWRSVVFTVLYWSVTHAVICRWQLCKWRLQRPEL